MTWRRALWREHLCREVVNGVRTCVAVQAGSSLQELHEHEAALNPSTSHVFCR